MSDTRCYVSAGWEDKWQQKQQAVEVPLNPMNAWTGTGIYKWWQSRRELLLSKLMMQIGASKTLWWVAVDKCWKRSLTRNLPSWSCHCIGQYLHSSSNYLKFQHLREGRKLVSAARAYFSKTNGHAYRSEILRFCFVCDVFFPLDLQKNTIPCLHCSVWWSFVHHPIEVTVSLIRVSFCSVPKERVTDAMLHQLQVMSRWWDKKIQWFCLT